MLANPDFCDLAWHIGRASLGANEKQIWHLTKIYWYTVEVRCGFLTHIRGGCCRRMRQGSVNA